MIALLCTLAFALGEAQEIDAVHFKGARPSGSLLDRSESASERRDYVALQKASTATSRRQLTEAFLERYPASWLLASVYQAAASASLELNERERAIEEGRLSLRLMPENAPLLVVMAQVQLGLGKRAAAARDARDALLWMRVFAAPGGVKEVEWKSGVKSLEDAARAVITQTGGRQPWLDTPVPPVAKNLKFAGSEACRGCHEAVYGAWRKTGMSAMLRPISDARLLADFSQPMEFEGQGGKPAVRAGGGSKPFFEFAMPGGGAWKKFRVDFAIGSKWQQAYATKLADDRIFVFPVQYNALEKRWLNYWETIDAPGSERANISSFPRLTGATSYQRNCAACHTSQLRLTRLDDATMQKAAFREGGVNCEMCHGPSADHVALKKGSGGAPGPPLRFSKLDPFEATMVCGQCHRQSALRNLGQNGEMNYKHDPPYFDRLLNQPYSEFGSRAFYKDGRFRETTFIGEAFLRSACFRRGAAQCASCHDVHGKDAASNPTSLKFRDNPDQMCVQCHLAIGAQASAHTHHAANSPGARCTSCHMPKVMNSVMFSAASHQIDDIPHADWTQRFGQKESPNACLICHKDKDANWAGATLDGWKPGR